VKDIANKLNVSLSTVHKALTGKPGISEGRRAEILAAAEEMGYSVNTAARILSRKSITLGIVIPSMWQEYFFDMKSGIDKGLEELKGDKVNGIYYVISDTPKCDELNNILQWIEDNEIDALIYCASHHTLNNMARSLPQYTHRPIFWAGGNSGTPSSITNITVDVNSAGRLAADMLYCIYGKDIRATFFTGSLENRLHKAKADAFIERVKEYGGKVVKICETDDIPENAYRAMETLMASDSDINAIYAGTSTSEPICRYMEEHSLRDTVALIGTDIFDSLKEYMKKGIMRATVCQNQKKAGKLAVSYAYEYLNKTASYGNAQWKPKSLLAVKPTLLLRADIEDDTSEIQN